MALDPHGLLAAALSVRVTADTTGLEAEVASKLTAAERRATLASERISAATGRIAETGVVSSAKLEASTLRQTAAQESYNRLLRAGETDTVRLARAQASLITAQAGVRREQARLTEASAATTATGEAATVGLLGGTRNLLGAAAGVGVFTALKRGVGAYEALTGSVRSFQRATGAAAPDASRFVAILDRYGLSGDRATQAILRFGRNIAEHPAKLHQFGVEIARNADGTVNLTKSLLNANTAFHQTPDATTRASLALSLFGRGGQALLPVLAANRDTLQQFMDQAERSGVVFSQADLDRAKQLAMSQKDLSQAWQGFEILLARGVVPVLHDVDKAGTDVMNLFTDHRTIGMAVLRVGELAGALYAINRAVKTFDSVRNSTLFTKVLNVGGTEAQTAANLELAGSYNAVGAAAGRAAASVGALDVAEGAGGGAGALASMAALRSTIPVGRGAALLGRGAAVARLGLTAASVVDPMLLAALIGGASDDQSKTVNAALSKQTSLGKQFSYRNGRYYAGNVPVTDPNLIAALQTVNARIHGAPDLTYEQAQALRARTPFLQGSGLGTLNRENAALSAFLGQVASGGTPTQQAATGRAALLATGRQYAAGVDIFSRAASLTPHADPGAAAAVTSAQTRAADAARRVTLDEQRLNALRATGKASTLQLASAEETLRLAKERSAKASQDVTDAEKKSHAERLPTARNLLGTLTSQANRAAEDAKAVQRLYAEGLKPDVVGKILAENANKPGALESIAKTLTPALAKQLQAQFRHLSFDGSLIAGTPQQWRKAGNERALDFMAGVQATFNTASPAVIAARVAGVQRKIDSTEPVTSRRRQRSLSGSPSLPHGA